MSAYPIAYKSLGVRWDKVESFRVKYSDGQVKEISAHVSEHMPYWHFGHSDTMAQPPTYDETL